MSDSKHGEIVMRTATWLNPILQPGGLERESIKAAQKLEGITFDAIAFTGLSGSVLSSVLALKLNKLLYCVRKTDERRHSDYEVEGPATGLRYVIVDDLIMSGDTMKRIIRKVEQHTNKQAVCVGIYLYREEKIIVNQTDLNFFAGRGDSPNFL